MEKMLMQVLMSTPFVTYTKTFYKLPRKFANCMLYSKTLQLESRGFQNIDNSLIITDNY